MEYGIVKFSLPTYVIALRSVIVELNSIVREERAISFPVGTGHFRIIG